MTRAPSKARRPAVWQAAFLALGLLVFAMLIYGVGLQAIVSVLGRPGWLTPLVLVPYLTSYLVDSIGWWWVLHPDLHPSPGKAGRSPRLLQLFAIRAAGEAVNAITPTAYLGGEPLKAWLLQRQGVSLVSALASVIVSKTALMLTQGGFVFLGLLVALREWHTAIPLPVAAVVGIPLCVLVFGLIIGIQRRGPRAESRKLTAIEPRAEKGMGKRGLIAESGGLRNPGKKKKGLEGLTVG